MKGKMWKAMKKFILSLCVIFFAAAALLVTGAAPAAFANSGNIQRSMELTPEERKIADVRWVEPPLRRDPVPCFEFYSGNKGGQLALSPYISANDKGIFTTFPDFSFDPKTSEYVLLGVENNDFVEIGRARLVPGNPEKLNISGTFIDRESNKRVRYQYELVRESDARSMRAPASRGGFTVEDSEWAWLEGTWKPQSGNQAEVTFRGSAMTFIELFDKNGEPTELTTATAVWNDEIKAFELLHIAMYPGMRREILRKFGYLRPSSGEHAPSQTLEFQFTNQDGVHNWVLRKGS